MCSPNGDQSGQWEINQYDITMATLYAHYEITICNDVARDIQCDVTMSNEVTMCTYHYITTHDDIIMNVYYVFSALYLIVIFYYW